MLSKFSNKQGGFVEYLAIVVVIILILIGLRVDLHRYAEEHHITNYWDDSVEYFDNKILEPAKYLWRQKILGFFAGQKAFGTLDQKIYNRNHLPEDKTK